MPRLAALDLDIAVPGDLSHRMQTFLVRMNENRRMPTLNLEHIACNVADPPPWPPGKSNTWGCVSRATPAGPAHIHFLADAAGRAVIEIYCNAGDAIPDYAAMNPLRFHIAFAAADPDAAREALVAAGATFVDERAMPDGSRLLMLRDPWGSLQLCKRPDTPSGRRVVPTC